MARPAPATETLLRFLDFFYAVVFALFVRRVYEKLIYNPAAPADGDIFFTPWANLNTGDNWLIFLFAAAAAFFIALDWIHARLLTEAHTRYRDHWRFFLDFIIAFLSYGALLEAAEGRLRAISYISLIYILGAVWAAYCLAEDQNEKTDKHYEDDLTFKLRAIGISHFIGAIGLALLIYALQRLDPGTILVTPLAFTLCAGVVAFCLVFEIGWHVLWIREEFWVGPTGLPLVRSALTLFFGTNRRPSDDHKA